MFNLKDYSCSITETFGFDSIDEFKSYVVETYNFSSFEEFEYLADKILDAIVVSEEYPEYCSRIRWSDLDEIDLLAVDFLIAIEEVFEVKDGDDWYYVQYEELP